MGLSGGSHKKERAYDFVWGEAVRVRMKLAEHNVKATICGSLRRGKKVVGDVDLVVAEPLGLAINCIVSDCIKDEVPCESVNSGPKSVDLLINDIQFNIIASSEESWGAATLYLTGSKLFNILMRGRAKKEGYKLNRYGVWHGEELIAGRSEEQIFKCLGMEVVEPRDREIKPNAKYSFPR
uniref:Putative DNA polymerase n=1 Tax=viral metagenome TaxID=1070528 RepID=A0A6M3LVD9_9ZZZZ